MVDPVHHLVTVGCRSSYPASRSVYESQASVLAAHRYRHRVRGARGSNLDTEAELVSSAWLPRSWPTTSASRRSSSLLGKLSVDRPAETEILEISYRDPDPALARRVATGFAEGYLAFREAAASKVIVETGLEMQAQIDALEERLIDLDRELLALSDNDPRRGGLEAEASALRNLILQTQIARLSLPGDVTGGRVIQPASLPGSPISPTTSSTGSSASSRGSRSGSGRR
jgi:uncharacterized protein involved in exopolysaccharide biosynthesis